MQQQHESDPDLNEDELQALDAMWERLAVDGFDEPGRKQAPEVKAMGGYAVKPLTRSKPPQPPRVKPALP